MKLLTNPGKLSPAKGIAMFVSAVFPKLSNQDPKDPPDWIILDICALLSYIFIDMLLVQVFLDLVVCLFARNNSCDNFSSSKVF